MTLGNVYFAYAAWQELAKLQYSPKVAYALLKYVKRLAEEHAIVEQQRIALIHEITKTEAGAQASIQLNTPEYTEYATKFGEVLATDCDLEKFSMSMDELLESIADSDSALSAQQLSLVEPFMKENDDAIQECCP